MISSQTHSSDDRPLNNSQAATYRPPGRGRGRNTQPGRSNRRGSGSSNRGRPQYFYPAGPQPTQRYPGLSYPPWAWWAPPPYPHPTAQQTPWPVPWQNPPTSGTAANYNPQAAHVAYSTEPSAQQINQDQQQPSYDALKPTELQHAFQAMHLNKPDPSWYMDTGASSHLMAESGTQEWEDAFTSQ
ncbi:hypothetical protein L1887_31678 [Cichorium endivia]|nr:hypothetical protein L1887_31678 [Cichorium endivia]